MPQDAWWTSLNASSLLALRSRLLAYVRSSFGKSLPDEAEDIVQQAFASLYGQREQVSPDDDGLFRFLRTAARNLALDRIRSANRRKKHFERVLAAVRASAPGREAPSLEADEENEKVWQVFCALDELERLLVWSHAVEGKSIRAISQELNLNWHRVADMLYSALRRLRKAMDA
jgi:RNA polymerase sigma factor (sigma-70 family)